MTLDALRQLFPHTQATIYLNHAATGPHSVSVVDALHGSIEDRHRGAIENFEAFMPVLDATRERLATLVGAAPATVELAPNTSYALNVLAEGLDWQPGDRIALPACEFPANVYPFLHQQRKGVEVDFIPHRDGVLRLDDIAAALTPQTRLLTLSWVQFLSGFRTDLEAVGRLCRERDVLFCVDAIQGLGALRLDVERCGIDFLACGGHKWLMAPQGVGFLYVRPSLMERLTPMAGWLHGPVDWERFFDYELAFHPDARRFWLGTLNSLGVVGLHAALGLYQKAGPAWCERQVLDRAHQLAEGLDALALERYGTDDPAHASGIVTVRHAEADAVFAYLKERGVTASVRNRMLRFAPTYYNSPGEIDRALDLLQRYGQTTIAAGAQAEA